MATPQLSPGVRIREVDLTVGRADNVLDNIGAIAGPFRIGPIDDPIDISTEEETMNDQGEVSLDEVSEQENLEAEVNSEDSDASNS